MARFGCICGNTLSNSMCPSESIIHVVTKKKVDNAIGYNKNVGLLDFISNWDELTNSEKSFVSKGYHFWYCPDCRRVSQCEIHIGGKAVSIYKPVENGQDVDFNKLLEMEELIVFSDIEEDKATEKEPSVLLTDFLESLPKIRYFISDDKKYVYIYDCNAEKISAVYQSEGISTNDLEEKV